MISLGAAIVRAAIRAYTYPYRKRFASLSRSVTLKNRPYAPPKGFAFSVEKYGGVRVEKLTPLGAVNGIVLQFHGGGHTAPMSGMYRKAAERLAANCGCTVYSVDYRTAADLVYPSVHDECYTAYTELCNDVLSGGYFAAIGDSFGANLLLSACLRARDDRLPLPSAIVCICPFADMAASGSSYRENCYKDPLYAMPKRYDFERYEKKYPPHISVLRQYAFDLSLSFTGICRFSRISENSHSMRRAGNFVERQSDALRRAVGKRLFCRTSRF